MFLTHAPKYICLSAVCACVCCMYICILSVYDYEGHFSKPRKSASGLDLRRGSWRGPSTPSRVLRRAERREPTCPRRWGTDMRELRSMKMGSRAMFKMDIGFYRRIELWFLLKSSYRIHVPGARGY